MMGRAKVSTISCDAWATSRLAAAAAKNAYPVVAALAAASCGGTSPAGVPAASVKDVGVPFLEYSAYGQAGLTGPAD